MELKLKQEKLTFARRHQHNVVFVVTPGCRVGF
jgi:hypothetical protein